MSEEKQEGQKTIVSFVVGLLIGGLLVWAFSSPADDSKEMKSETDDNKEMTDDSADKVGSKEMDDKDEVVSVPAPTLPVGDGKVSVANTAAGKSLALDSVTYPISEGWIGVRDYNDGQLGGLLGVSRFSEVQGLVPTEVILQRGTEAGMTYAVVIYTESGDRQFSMADDVQLDTIFATFTAK